MKIRAVWLMSVIPMAAIVSTLLLVAQPKTGNAQYGGCCGYGICYEWGTECYASKTVCSCKVYPCIAPA